MQSRKLAFGLAVLAAFLVVDSALAYYNPATGRFLNRDPIGEPGAMLVRGVGARAAFIPRDPRPARLDVGEFRPLGRQHASGELSGVNLYGYVENDPLGQVDPLGLIPKFVCCSAAQQQELLAAYIRAKVEIRGIIQSINGAISADKGQYPAFTQLKLKKAIRYLDCANKQLDNLNISCDPCAGPCKNSYAWVKWVFARTIHVCPAFFNNAPPYYNRQQFQGATLVHEATHKCGTNDARYFWQNGESPHDVGFGFFAFQDIASTYDTWILEGFCIPGYNCP